MEWKFLTRLKSNRLVNPDDTGNRPVSQIEIGPEGAKVHLKGFGMVEVSRKVAKDGDAEHWCTNDLEMDEATRQTRAGWSWKIEHYHRGSKQETGTQRYQMRLARSQRNHIGCAIRAFVRLEWHRIRWGVSWAEANLRVIRDAITGYLGAPLYTLPPPATG